MARGFILKLLLGSTAIVAVSLSNDSFEAWHRSRNQQFATHSQGIHDDHHQFQQDRERLYNDFRERMNKRWGEFKASTRDQWVEYSLDGRARHSLDYEDNMVTVEVLIDEGDDEAELTERAISAALKTRGSRGATPLASDSEYDSVSQTPILSGVSNNGVPLGEEEMAEFIKETAKNRRVEIRDVSEEDGLRKQRVATVSFPLLPNSLQIRMEPYLDLVKKYSLKYGVDPALVLGIMHTESHFNPAARSPVGAIGLMQLMPASGGFDAYRMVTGSEKRPSVEYLYDPRNSIELGCAYLHILDRRYLRSIEDSLSRRYCVIAAYNTGAGNVARAFSDGRNINRAASSINSLSSEEVFGRMVKDLPYRETQEYIQKVTERSLLYKDMR